MTQFILVDNDKKVFGPQQWDSMGFSLLLLNQYGMNISLNEREPLGVFRLNNELAFFPVEINSPTYNPAYQTLSNEKIEIRDTSAILTYDVIDIPVEVAKSQALSTLASLRYDKQSSGMKFGDTTIATDTSSQALLNGAYNLALHDAELTIQFKTKKGWININAEQIILLAVGVGKFIQKCFSVEKIHYDKIMAMSSSEQIFNYIEHHLTDGWPE
jgi:hypothetical protein